MVEVFAALKKLRGYVDADAAGREWSAATAMVINGKAGMQIMGDWAKSEFTAAGKVPGKDYQCLPFPGTQKAFDYNIDSLVMFKLSNAENRKAQEDLARSVLDPSFQKDFQPQQGLHPGSPGRRHGAVRQLRPAVDEGLQAGFPGRQPGAEHGPQHGRFQLRAGAIFDVVTNFFNDPPRIRRRPPSNWRPPSRRRRSKSLARSPAWAPLDPPDWLRAAERHGWIPFAREKTHGDQFPVYPTAPVAPRRVSPLDRLQGWLPKLVLAQVWSWCCSACMATLAGRCCCPSPTRASCPATSGPG